MISRSPRNENLESRLRRVAFGHPHLRNPLNWLIAGLVVVYLIGKAIYDWICTLI